MAVRRSLKRKKDEEQMSERESRESSVRARISRDREWNDPGKENSLEKRRFVFPGKTRSSPDQSQQSPLTFSPAPRQRPGGTDFEAHLQEVWSVRKNIPHKQHQQPNPATGNSGSKTSILQPGTGTVTGGISLTQPDKYSRYRAVPAHEPAQQRTRDTVRESSTAVIETVTPWSLRKPSTHFNTKYHLTDSRPSHHHPSPSSHCHPGPSHQQSAVEMTSSSPSAAGARGRGRGRGRGGEPARICLEDFEPVTTHKRDHQEKVDYAKTMAKGYLRSVGSGEYAPQESNYTKSPNSPPETGQATKWKRVDSDEFDF